MGEMKRKNNMQYLQCKKNTSDWSTSIEQRGKDVYFSCYLSCLSHFWCWKQVLMVYIGLKRGVSRSFSNQVQKRVYLIQNHQSKSLKNNRTRSSWSMCYINIAFDSKSDSELSQNLSFSRNRGNKRLNSTVTLLSIRKCSWHRPNRSSMELSLRS